MSGERNGAPVGGDVTGFRGGLLDGRRILVAGPGPAPDGLGALIERVEDPASFDDEAAALTVREFAGRAGGLEAAVIDAASVFAVGGPEGMATSLDTSWRFARAVATEAMIDGGGGTIVLVAPTAEGGDIAAAAVADGLENMARALSVEWARFDIRVVAICPRQGAGRESIRDLITWLCSPSGTYVSGCRLDPGGR